MTLLAIFDFDQTLAATEVSPFIGRADMRDRGFGGAERVRMLHAMLVELTTQCSVICAICSVNSKDVIQPALQTLDLLGFFQSANIYDRAYYENCRCSKSRVISDAIVPIATGGLAQDVLFVDDDPQHVMDVRLHLPRGGLRVKTLLVPRVGDSAADASTDDASSSASSTTDDRPANMNAGLLPSQMPAGGMRAAQIAEALQWARELAAQASALAGGGGGGRGAGAASSSSAPSAAELASQQVQEQRQQQQEQQLVCALFVPKKATGPLSRRCATCGAHQSDHAGGGGEDVGLGELGASAS